MGMYTELIFGAELKEDTPKQVINALKYMLGAIEEKPQDFPLEEGRAETLFTQGSFYFGVSSSVCKMWQSGVDNSWRISTRSNIKNYENEIEAFLEWIKQYVWQGSGHRDMFAIVIPEDQEPTLHFLYDV